MTPTVRRMESWKNSIFEILSAKPRIEPGSVKVLKDYDDAPAPVGEEQQYSIQGSAKSAFSYERKRILKERLKRKFYKFSF